MTDDDLESRLRRDLAELGALPSTVPRERRAPRLTRPALTVTVALIVVLALVAASVAIVRNIDDRSATPPVTALPRAHTILEQPSAVTGSSSSIVAKPFTQVCEKWRELPAGVDCSSLQARYVWSPGATKGPYTFGAIEVVGSPDLKLAQDGTVRGAYPLFKMVSVRGHRARLFGMPDVGEAGDVVTMVWNERPDLQVWIHLEADPAAERYPNALTNEILAFAHGMRPVAIDPAKSAYVMRSGTTPLEYKERAFPSVDWSLTWRPSDRQLCATAESARKCLSPVKSTAATVRAQGLLLEGCQNAWLGTQSLVFGIAPDSARRMVISFSKESGGGYHATTPVAVPPGERHLRVFAAALDHPVSARVTALDARGHALPHAAQTGAPLPPFQNACSPDRAFRP
jgi:hypothetical protein